MEILFLFVGLALGFLAGYWLVVNNFKNRIHELETKCKLSDQKSSMFLENVHQVNEANKIKSSQLYEQAKFLAEKESDLKNFKVRCEEMSVSKLELETKLQKTTDQAAKMHDEKLLMELEKNSLIEKLNLLESQFLERSAKYELEIKEHTQKLFEEKSAQFTELNKVNIESILKPLSEKIKDFEKKVEDTYEKESKQRFSLEKEISNLVDLNKQIGKEANNLVNALKGQSKVQGNWGEMILESILEKSGLSKNREYFVQESFTTNGKRLQPDIVIHFPDKRFLIIDSKVSLTAYERYVSLEDATLKQIALNEHIKSIKNHINELSAKDYQQIFEKQSPDYVLMFVPVEPAFLIAVQSCPELFSDAFQKRIILISPTNLIAIMKIISELWKSDYQNRNALDIAQKGGELYDKFVSFTEDLLEIGKRIDETGSAYQNAMNKLCSGKGNVIRKVQEIKNLGAKAKKSLAEKLLDKSEGMHSQELNSYDNQIDEI